jgi:hypothetical protein
MIKQVANPTVPFLNKETSQQMPMEKDEPFSLPM